ncbi:MAG: hypothetical protein CMP23_12265, partial [Rickettsiales bacterium]|nr:hypothetical protein [Rickettsiales bacterium]
MSSVCPEGKSLAQRIEDVSRQLDWKKTPEGQRQYVRQTRANICVLLAQHPHRLGELSWDEFLVRVMLNDEQITDDQLMAIGIWLDRTFDMRSVSLQLLKESALYVARQNRVNPLRDYLCSLAWDGVPRAETWLMEAMQADDTALNREYSKKWLIQAVARALDPGCQADTVLVLTGKQGIGKSTLLGLLASSDWFNDTDLDMRSKDRFMQAHSAWIHEVPELSSFRRARQDAVKAFITSRQDRFRVPYATSVEVFPRRCVFVATTNEEEFLVDATGSRRFWVMRVRSLDRRWVIENRDQLWAEAVHLYRNHEPWWLDAGCELLRQAA